MKKTVVGLAGLTALYTLSLTGLAIAQDPVAEGKKMYEQECASCHMANGSGSGIYPAVDNLSKEKGLEMLKGYRDDTYGGSMKSVMASFVKGKTDQQLEALAEYMATLKK